MKYLLNSRNLLATHYDSNTGDHTLQFYACSMDIYVTVHGLGPVKDQHYWDDEDNLRTAIASVDVNDIDVYVTINGGKAVKID